MTWEQFELTGTVEDYLRYKRKIGIDRAAWEAREKMQCLKEAEYGTTDYSDRHGTGHVPLR